MIIAGREENFGLRLQLCRAPFRAKNIRVHSTLCLKKGTPTLSTVTLERINGF